MNGTAAVFHMAVRCLTPVWLRPVISHMDQWQYLLLLCALVPYSIGVRDAASRDAAEATSWCDDNVTN